MINQIGKFFFFIGLIILIVFLGTTQVAQPVYTLCFPGFLFVIIGTFMMTTNWQRPPENSGRFVTWRKLQAKPKQDGPDKHKEKR